MNEQTYQSKIKMDVSDGNAKEQITNASNALSTYQEINISANVSTHVNRAKTIQ